MIVIAIIVSMLLFSYGMVIVSIIKSRRKEKSEWDKYWDQVFERNKNR